MEALKEIKSKIEQNKQEKKTKLLENAYALFGSKGFNNTSIQDIVNKAGVAKGTFYLYFKDKHDIRDQLVADKSSQLFLDARIALEDSHINSFDNKIIFIIDHVIDDLKENPDILGFVNKDLSLGFYSNELTKIFDDHALGLYDMFMQGVRDESITLKNPDITFFMIVELVGSTCYSCIMKQVPCDIDTYKPYLYATIKQLMHESKK